MRERRWTALLAAAAVFGLFFRLWRLDADAPEWLDWSVGIWTDEGIYAQNAWNHVHTGRWLLDEFAPMAVTPVITLLDRAVFALGGTTVLAMRAMAVTLGIAGSALLAGGVWKSAGKSLGCVALVLVALDPALVHFNRLALNETVMFPVLAGALWLASDRTKTWRLAATGALGVLAFLVKPFGLIVVPIAVAAIVVDAAIEPDLRWKPTTRRLAALGVPVALGLAAVFVLAYLPHREVVDRMLHYFGAGKVGGSVRLLAEDLYRNFPHDDFVQRFPVPCLGVLLAAGILRRDDLRASPPLRLWTCWLVLTHLYLASLNYNAIRYYFVALPAVVAVAAWALATAWREPARLLSPRLALVLLLPIVHRAVRLVLLPHTFYGGASQPRGFAVTGLLALVGLLILWSRRTRRDRLPFRAIYALLALVFVAWNLRRDVQAAVTTTHEMRDTAAELRRLGVTGPIVGTWAVAMQEHLGLPAHRTAPGLLNVPATWPALGARWYFGPEDELRELRHDAIALECWEIASRLAPHGQPLVLARPGRACADSPVSQP